MKTTFILSILLLTVVLMVACGQKADQAQTIVGTDGFKFESFAAAEKVAAERDLYMVLDFYTDW